MKARSIIRVLADRAHGMFPESHRRKASDYAAILVGVAMISVMQDTSVVADEAALAAYAPAPAPIVETVTPEPPQVFIPTVEPAPAVAQAQPVETAAVATAAPIESPTAEPTAPPIGAQAEPAKVEASRATTSSRSARPNASPAEKFIDEHAAEAQLSMQETGIPASVTLAQAILESNSGQSGLAVKAHNYFGIKGRTKEGPAGVVYMDTWEHLGGKDVTKREPFRAYHNAAESFTDHGLYFEENARYAEAMRNTDDARTFAKLIHQAGYATDPNYSTKLIRLMDTYDLYQYDR